MKKIFMLAAAAVMMMGLTACGAKEEKKTTEEVKESVVVADSGNGWNLISSTDAERALTLRVGSNNIFGVYRTKPRALL